MAKKAGHSVVTGGAGFIGSHLVERLLADGHRVVVIDDCSTGSLENLAAVGNEPRLSVLTQAVSACPNLGDLVGEASGIYHLAAAVGVELVLRSPVRTLQTNLHETECILSAASQHGTPLLLTSSSEVYGRSSKEEFSEEDDLLIGPPQVERWSYACSKLMDEFLAMAHHREFHLPVVVARLFNTVGPRQRGHYGMVLPRFIQAAQADLPLRVYGDGTQTRCFCYVADAVEALVRLLRCPAAHGGIFNVGSTEEISIRQLAAKTIALLHSRSPIELVPYEAAYGRGFEDMRRRKPVIRRLEERTGFKPGMSLEQIILRTAAATGSPTAE